MSHKKFYGLLYRPKIDKNGKVPHYHIFMNYYFFFTNIIAYEVLHGHVSFVFEKNEHFYKFITLQFLACKKYILKHTFKDSQNWSKVIHSSL
jgi:hypothetical protein